MATKPLTMLTEIEDFLAQKRIAIAGVSRNSKDFTRLLYAEFGKRGYDVVPVNPAVTDLDGVKCYARVQDIQPPVDAVLIMTPPTVTDQIVKDCQEAGVTRVWMHRGEGIGAVSESAVAFCQQHGISVVVGQCPYMFFENTGMIHRMHGFIKKVTHTYPN